MRLSLGVFLCWLLETVWSGVLKRAVPLITDARRGEGGSSLLYFSIAYYMQKGGGEGVQITCKNAYVINGRPQTRIYT